jgi:putative ABC transport system ATP-binding protein
MTPDRNPILSIHSANKTFRMGEVDVKALRDATLDIYPGEFIVIVGPSGSGKSTLLNLMGGMDRPTSGSVMFQDKDLSQVSDDALTTFRRNQVGFVFQFYNLIPTLTALENIQVATELHRNSMNPEEALKHVGLSERADSFPSQLSGGEQQRVSIARALAKRPGLLLCDEPTGALDIETGKQILGLLYDLKNSLDTTVVLITHNTAIAEIADRVFTLRDGKIHDVRKNSSPRSPSEISW